MIELPPCPRCGGTLELQVRYDTRIACLAGSSLKLGATPVLWLDCLACDFEERGEPT